MSRPGFILTLEPEPDKPGEPPVEVRLRQWLKLGLRTFGLRCVEIRQADGRDGHLGRPKRAKRPRRRTTSSVA